MRARAAHKLAQELRTHRQLQLAVRRLTLVTSPPVATPRIVRWLPPLQVRHLEERESLEVLRGAAVVGLTTTGAAKYQSLVRQLGAAGDLVITPQTATIGKASPPPRATRSLVIPPAGARVLLMEEAAEVIEAHAYNPDANPSRNPNPSPDPNPSPSPSLH